MQGLGRLILSCCAAEIAYIFREATVSGFFPLFMEGPCAAPIVVKKKKSKVTFGENLSREKLGNVTEFGENMNNFYFFVL